MTDDTQTGGTEWELRQAEAALEVAETPAARQLARRRHNEALRNMMLGVVAPSFEHALEQILSKHVDALSRRMDNADRARLKRNTEFQDQLDARLDAFGAKQDTALAELKEVSARLGKQSKEIDALKMGYQSNAGRLDAIERLLGSRPEQRAIEHQAIVDEILRRLALERGGDGNP